MLGSSLSGVGSSVAGLDQTVAKTQQKKLVNAGGTEAAAYGYAPKAQGLTRAGGAVAMNDALMQRNVARVNVAYGHLPTMRGSVFDQALGNQAVINGAIDRTTSLVRDAGQAANTGDAEEAARQASINAANTGMTGSSVDLAGKRRVLGGYLQGRAGVATDTANTRIDARGAMEKERLGAIDRIRGKLGGNLEQQIADTDVLRSLGEARRNIIPQAIGNGIESAGNLYATNMLYNQMTSGSSAGARLPSLSGGTSRTSGGYATGGLRS